MFELDSALIHQLGMSIQAGKNTSGNSNVQGSLGRISPVGEGRKPFSEQDLAQIFVPSMGRSLILYYSLSVEMENNLPLQVNSLNFKTRCEFFLLFPALAD